ncbi:uncharacterized protein LOC129590924 [Paramacrobiotus metropolitanus]|uniref:uncharacterized protein LOC129590924 n=1 Tax=Paramacrobiotus metropolitanus TaxID=2943436 RepID=UPI002445E801|nr:uncharacterized protein LOC129590924 [Paramacrobiotus metropolitanus]
MADQQLDDIKKILDVQTTKSKKWQMAESNAAVAGVSVNHQWKGVARVRVARKRGPPAAAAARRPTKTSAAASPHRPLLPATAVRQERGPPVATPICRECRRPTSARQLLRLAGALARPNRARQEAVLSARSRAERSGRLQQSVRVARAPACGDGVSANFLAGKGSAPSHPNTAHYNILLDTPVGIQPLQPVKHQGLPSANADYICKLNDVTKEQQEADAAAAGAPAPGGGENAGPSYGLRAGSHIKRSAARGKVGREWTEQETLLLLEALKMCKGDWNKIDNMSHLEREMYNLRAQLSQATARRWPGRGQRHPEQHQQQPSVARGRPAASSRVGVGGQRPRQR